MLVLLAVAAAFASQETPAAPPKPSREAVDWAAAMGARFRQLSDPVTAAWGVANMAAIVCPADPAAASALFREAFTRLEFLTPNHFNTTGPPLPVPSYSALWKFVVPAAAKCDPAFKELADSDSAKLKMDEEQRGANRKLQIGMTLIKDKPDRAAQLAEAAITASVPGILDMARYTLFLSRMRDRAPELSDDLYLEGLDFISSAAAPNASLLMEIGKYLFTTPRYLEYPDKDQMSETFTVGSATLANFSDIRESADTDDVHAYIEAALKVLTSTDNPNYDPVTGYAIAYQLLPKAQDVAPDLVDKLQEVLAELTALAGSSVSAIQAKLAEPQPADPNGGEAARLRYRRLGVVLAKANAGDFEVARDLLKSIDDLPVRTQVGSLIDFAQSAAAIEKHDIQWALTLANTQRTGIKRSLLYSGIVSASPTKEAALSLFQLALREAQPLPAEQRMVLYSAAGAAIQKHDPEGAYLALGLLVAANNDALNRPRLGRFDPKIIRRPNIKADSSSDSALILYSRKGLYEVVDTLHGRRTFHLKIPGVTAFNLPAMLSASTALDAPRAESIVTGVRDDGKMVKALGALAAMRLALPVQAAPPSR